MILLDASVWADHLRYRLPAVVAELERGFVLGHPHVRGEVALGSLHDRDVQLELLDSLPQANVADDREVAVMIERRRWFGRGIGYIDAHLLAATLLTPGSTLWTRDKRLHDAAAELGRAFVPA